MKKLVFIALLFVANAQAVVVQPPVGPIINCSPTSIGTIVCI